MNDIDEMGNHYTRLQVVERLGAISKPDRNIFWVCVCDCGEVTYKRGKDLRSGRAKSCGCLATEERRKSMGRVSRRHGMFGTKIYATWSHMKQRCEDKNVPAYRLYGARGIKVYEPWSKDFVKFYEYMGNPPTSKHSIDRIDNDSNYEPGNVRWTTQTVQMNNRRNNVRIEYKGQTKTIAEWARYKDMNIQTLYARLNQYGWPVERALNDKVKSL